MSDTVFEMNDKGDVLFLHADMREALKALPENSVDSVVTDPPYHLQSIVKRFSNTSEIDNTKTSERVRNRVDGYARLVGTGFMGARWDGGDIAFQVDTWREVMRVLKPGGHLAAFGGTRTFARMSVAIEDAGFEIRDTLMWCYSTGFPKSHDVSKGIDKAAGAEREVVGFNAEAYAKRNKRRAANGEAAFEGGFNDADNGAALTAPATDAAKEWQGWGTSLKPSLEPVVLARKPLSEKTVVANVLRWRTGAINIDDCRVPFTLDETPYSYPNGAGGNTFSVAKGIDGTRTEPTFGNAAGRWPANLVHDGSDEVVALFPSSKGQQGDLNETGRPRPTKTCFGDMPPPKAHAARNDSGSAARFFYASKASRADRAGSRHPTIKPISLMRWLTRLITPPGGLVLDPFAGSGTTGAAALEEGMRCLLIEREAEYADDIRRRLEITDIGLI